MKRFIRSKWYDVHKAEKETIFCALICFFLSHLYFECSDTIPEWHGQWFFKYIFYVQLLRPSRLATFQSSFCLVNCIDFYVLIHLMLLHAAHFKWYHFIYSYRAVAWNRRCEQERDNKKNTTSTKWQMKLKKIYSTIARIENEHTKKRHYVRNLLMFPIKKNAQEADRTV